MRNPSHARKPRFRPSDAPICYRAGLVSEALGDGEAAKAHWRNGVSEAHHPIPSVERFYVECCRWKLGEQVQAVANLGAVRHAIRARAEGTKTSAEDLLLLGLVEKALGDKRAARAAFEEALTQSPGHPVVVRELRRMNAGA